MARQERPVRAPEHEARLVDRVVRSPAKAAGGQHAVAPHLDRLVGDGGEVGEAPIGKHEGPRGGGVVADAQVVASVRSQGRAVHHDRVAHDPRSQRDEAGDRDDRPRPRWTGDATPPLPTEHQRQPGQQHECHRADEAGETEQHAGAAQTDDRCRLRQRAPQQNGEGGDEKSEKDRLGQGRGGVVDEVRLEGHDPRRDGACPAADDPTTDDGDEPDHGGAEHEVHRRRHPRFRVGQRRVHEDPAHTTEQTGVAHRVVRGRPPSIGRVAPTGGDVLGVAEVVGGIVGADVGAYRDEAPGEPNPESDEHRSDRPERCPAPARWSAGLADRRAPGPRWRPGAGAQDGVHVIESHSSKLSCPLDRRALDGRAPGRRASARSPANIGWAAWRRIGFRRLPVDRRPRSPMPTVVPVWRRLMGCGGWRCWRCWCFTGGCWLAGFWGCRRSSRCRGF